MIALGISLTLAVVYLFVIRLLDLNEREPGWAIVLLFAIGALAAAILRVPVSSATLELTVLPGAFAVEVARFLALFVGLEVVRSAARARGWSEINGPMDGVVYGASVGLGFAVGEVLVAQLQLAFGEGVLVSTSFLTVAWTSALAGLRHGLFGAIGGVGLSIFYCGRRRAARVLAPAVALLAAVAANALHRELAHGSALSGPTGYLRAWIALLIPLAFVLGVMVYALARERRVIAEELASEVEGGTVRAAELDLLGSHVRRQVLYLATLFKKGPARSAALHGLHNRQVQLALTKRRAAAEPDPSRRARLEAEAGRLRAALRERRRLHDPEGSASGGASGPVSGGREGR